MCSSTGLHKPQLCCQSLSVLTLKPRAGSVSWKQHYSIWKAPLHYLSLFLQQNSWIVQISQTQPYLQLPTTNYGKYQEKVQSRPFEPSGYFWQSCCCLVPSSEPVCEVLWLCKRLFPRIKLTWLRRRMQRQKPRNSPSKSCFLPLDSWHHPEGQQHLSTFLQFSSLDSGLRALKLYTSEHLSEWVT